MNPRSNTVIWLSSTLVGREERLVIAPESGYVCFDGVLRGIACCLCRCDKKTEVKKQSFVRS